VDGKSSATLDKSSATLDILERFRIISDVYRNSCKRFGLRLDSSLLPVYIISKPNIGFERGYIKKHYSFTLALFIRMAITNIYHFTTPIFGTTFDIYIENMRMYNENV